MVTALAAADVVLFYYGICSLKQIILLSRPASDAASTSKGFMTVI